MEVPLMRKTTPRKMTPKEKAEVKKNAEEGLNDYGKRLMRKKLGKR
jgi:hypothetical protein